jgi:hypothetical protein
VTTTHAKAAAPSASLLGAASTAGAATGSGALAAWQRWTQSRGGDAAAAPQALPPPAAAAAAAAAAPPVYHTRGSRDSGACAPAAPPPHWLQWQPQRQPQWQPQPHLQPQQRPLQPQRLWQPAHAGAPLRPMKRHVPAAFPNQAAPALPREWTDCTGRSRRGDSPPPAPEARRHDDASRQPPRKRSRSRSRDRGRGHDGALAAAPAAAAAHAPQPAPPPPVPPAAVVSADADDVACWLYDTRRNSVQGPFSLSQLASFAPHLTRLGRWAGLRVWRAGQAPSEAVLVTALLSQPGPLPM